MSCTDCYKGCAEIQPDSCIKYTGPSYSSLGINTYDPLSKVEEIILEKLTDLLVGEGIDLSSLDVSCNFVKNLIDGDTTLISVLNALIEASCSLKTSVDALSAQGASITYNTSCLTGLPTNPTQAQILQALLNKVCSMNTIVNTIYGDYVKASQLNSLIASYLTTSSTTAPQYTKMVPYVAYEYYGPLSNFDSSGKGITSVGFEKVYICNDSNGTPDKRGRVAVGAVQGVPGGALDSAVNPALPANAGTSYALNQKFGSSFVTLDVTQMPAHTHSATDAGHQHNITSTQKTDLGGGGAVPAATFTSAEAGGQTNPGFANISIGSAGGNLPHDNRQPSIAAYFIMYIP